MLKTIHWVLLLLALTGMSAVGCQSTGSSGGASPYDGHAGHSH